MDTSTTTLTPDLGPIPADWTIDRLLAHLADDRALDDPALVGPLRRLDAAITGSDGGRSLAAIVLVRSLVVAVAATPALRARTLHDVLTSARTRGAGVPRDARAPHDAPAHRPAAAADTGTAGPFTAPGSPAGAQTPVRDADPSASAGRASGRERQVA